MAESTEREERTGADVIPLEVADGPSGIFCFGELITIFRECDEMNRAEFASVLRVGEAYLRDVEACREVVSVERGAAWASVIGYPATVFVERVLQDLVDDADLAMSVRVEVG